MPKGNSRGNSGIDIEVQAWYNRLALFSDFSIPSFMTTNKESIAKSNGGMFDTIKEMIGPVIKSITETVRSAIKKVLEKLDYQLIGQYLDNPKNPATEETASKDKMPYPPPNTKTQDAKTLIPEEPANNNAENATEQAQNAQNTPSDSIEPKQEDDTDKKVDAFANPANAA